MKKKVIFVGLSGGVDSAVSAALLKKATPNNFEKLFGRPTPKGFRGYEVVGVFIKTWHPNFLACNEEEERRDAMRVAASLDIPFLTFDLERVYKKEVADYMISEYRAGRTPNPDVMCNREVKFGEFLKKALSMGVDYVATGHYAKNNANNIFLSLPAKATSAFEKRYLLKSKDPTKDQSYFLWTLKQEQLSKIIFPVGGLKKTEVRKLAKKFKLPVSDKKDSQGICFLGEVDLKNFLKHYIKEKKGKVINERGEVVGHHDGVVFYTLGERHGFTIAKKSPNDGPHYVVGKDVKKNILIVSQNKNSDTSLFRSVYKTIETNWVSGLPKRDKKYTAQVRYHGELLPCRVKVVNKSKAEIVFSKSVLVASGQSIVVYDKDICLGGGVVV
ncbi:MAG: tRNA 2-thiouridine(34) synthase MnmA [bacterium]|nr:tRNA 2-thiouridine(34) synthase MnmA [bacterium]